MGLNMNIKKIRELNVRTTEPGELQAKIFEVAKLYKPDKEVFPIGFTEFDNAMDGGVRGGELVVISGPTNEGKTTLAQNISINLDKAGIPTIWFSFEMNPWYIKEKFIKMGATSELRVYAPKELSENNLQFVEEHIEMAYDDFACKVAFIDHLHYLVPLSDIKNSSLMIGGIVRELKKIAVRQNIIIFLIAHIRKGFPGEALSLNSIRDSSLVSQESDYVYLIERLKEKDTQEKTQGDLYSSVTRIQLAKNRRTGKALFMEFEMKNNIFIKTNKQESKDLSVGDINTQDGNLERIKKMF